ncbi:phosphodiester glycosidase family protein [Aristaeella hokkaidonensis]|uniref:Phosphodiester glycosidase family protein n=1 Tax=Aristaeella hokkaidonensis TaxID=3046382 RepID=A0AC61NB15_9FIRM|nr:phosphodiester glycosidase family protein [Aristaeella hokkaidonensis]QUC68433.1 phosphodiester glycosidase family protein [Aristaeella hokkaidonensis]SNT95126.1 Exopolysaccharide biosynthesis protein [Aristaeella hokkaidonensis]
MRSEKRFLLVLAVVVLTFCMLGSAMAEIKPIPQDMLEHGTAPKAEGWIEPNKEYEDESIHAVLNQRKNYDSKSSDGGTTISWVVIEIKDPSQIRTALSFDSFDIKKGAQPEEIVPYLNAVVAFNDDYVKMNNFKGYVMRQGELLLNNLDDWEEGMKQDVLVVDDQGDLSVVQKATSADMDAFLAKLEADGKKAVNIFTFGPALVIDGVAQKIERNTSTHSLNLATARTAFCQLDTLKYAVFTVDSAKTGYGMNGQELADFIVKTFPECKVAYNLDGGGTSELWLGQKKVNKAIGMREIPGMIYFASAASGD